MWLAPRKFLEELGSLLSSKWEFESLLLQNKGSRESRLSYENISGVFFILGVDILRELRYNIYVIRWERFYYEWRLILLEKLQDILDDLDFIVESDIETSARLKLMEVISELDMKITEDEKGIWSDFATEGLLIDKSKPGVIQKVTVW